MIGKLIRMLIGRSVAKKQGVNGWAGAAAALLAPVIIKKGGSMLKKRKQARHERREIERGPHYLERPIGLQRRSGRGAGRRGRK